VSPLSKSPHVPLLCYVTDRQLLLPDKNFEDQSRALITNITSAAAAGIDWIQFREKDLLGRELLALTREAIAQTKRTSSPDVRTRILVNDRLDVALAEDASGVHLGEHSLPVREVRNWLDGGRGRAFGPEHPPIHSAERFPAGNFLVGVSCHSHEGALSAEENGADYIFFGPIFSTPSKAAFGPAQGLATLAKVCRAISIPVLAIGGITRENALSCLSAGAYGLAAIRLFQDSQDLSALVNELRSLG
jgi:thiamine-phosphate pyrophosphorylase